MSDPEYEELDPEQLSYEALRDSMWRSGDLLWKLDPHQREVHTLFEEWNERRRTPEYEAEVIAAEATLDDVWVEEIGRRFGKTAKWIIVLTGLGIKRPGAVFTYGTAFNKDIGEIVVPLARELLQDGPDDVRPEYRTSRQEANQGLFFPNGSVVKLVGLDEHPDAARGRFSDGIVLSEAGFMRGLEDLVRAVLLPQFQRRPWAFLALESSTPKQPDHDFRKIANDAIKRKAYVKRTIDDNQAITEREKARALRQTGGKDHPRTRREYYSEEVRDPDSMVVPEFLPEQHVRTVERPPYAIACSASDPGMRDRFGKVWGYWDFKAAKLVIERSWAGSNAFTRKVAAVSAAIEHSLYGTPPSYRMRTIPLRSTADEIGWLELLKGEPEQFLAPKLHELAQIEPRKRPDPKVQWRMGYPPGLYVSWGGSNFQTNPYIRTVDSDVAAARLIADLHLEYGMDFVSMKTEDKEAELNFTRDWFAAGKIIMLPGAGPVISHVKNALWNEKRTDWERSKDFGHFDCLAALRTLVRQIDVLRLRNPYPPHYVDKRDPQILMMPGTGQTSGISADIRSLVDALGGRRE